LHEERKKKKQIFMQCGASALPAVSALPHTCWMMLTTKEQTYPHRGNKTGDNTDRIF
jgi:hypothetical protein